MKIDLQKAFDSIDCSFLLKVLYIMKFPTVFINWIRSCITTPWFSISINGGLEGYFQGKRGIKQEDPISLYLFVLAMNVLSKLLDVAVVYGVLLQFMECCTITLSVKR